MQLPLSDPDSEFALPLETRHGVVYRVAVRAQDRAGNSADTIIGCVQIDKTPVQVDFAGFDAPGSVIPFSNGLLFAR